MNCEQIKDLLSAYYDGELDSARQQEIREHLEHCDSCRRELQSYEQMSALFRSEEEDAVLPAGDWSRLKASLDTQPAARTGAPQRISSTRMLMALAASVLVALTASWWLLRPSEDPHANAVLDLKQFVTDLESRPELAQSRLVSNYGGKTVTVEEATDALHRRPLFLDRTPPDLKLVSLNLLKMPCCTCPQGVYRTASGGTIYIFEHDVASGIAVGNCPMIAARCCNRGVKVGEVGDQLLATWRSNSASFTAVGLEDVEQLVRLVDSLERSNASM